MTQPLFPPLNSKAFNTFNGNAFTVFYCGVIGAICLFASSLLFAEGATQQSGKEKDPDFLLPIEIKADSFDTNLEGGISTYRGKVSLSQGSLLVKSQKMRIEHPNNVMKQFTATGKAAHFEKIIHSTQKRITGEADKITYAKPDMLFEGNARVSYNGNHIEGDVISFDLETQAIQASGKEVTTPREQASQDGNNSQAPQKQGVRVILKPDTGEPNESGE